MKEGFKVLEDFIKEKFLIGVAENMSVLKLRTLLINLIMATDDSTSNYIKIYTDEKDFESMYNNYGLDDKLYYNPDKKIIRIGLQDSDTYHEFNLSNNNEFDGVNKGLVPESDNTGNKFLCDNGEWKEIKSGITDLPNNDINLF